MRYPGDQRSVRIALLGVVALLGWLAATGPVVAAQGDTIRISERPGGLGVNGWSASAAISTDGRYVAFRSDATNLVDGDTNGVSDVFVHDTATGKMTRVSVHSTGTQADESSYGPVISSDGRYVAFQSLADNLVANDTNSADDVFVHDTATGITTRVSVDSNGIQADQRSSRAAISSDGRYVSFESAATNLVADDTNDVDDVFVHDTSIGVTTRVSVDGDGNQADGDSSRPAISADGRFIAFESEATDLVGDDTNNIRDVFVRDTATGMITRVSVDSNEIQADKLSSHAAISADGRYVAFASSATNLVPGDTNGEHDVFVHYTVGGLTARVSVSSTGAQGNRASGGPSITADGRYIAFWTESSTLVADDDNGVYDAFVRDTATATTTRVSVDSNGAEGDEESTHPVISADGRFVAFTSLAANLVSDDTNGLEDVFRHQLLPDPPPPTTTTILPGGDDPFVDDDNSVFESDIEALARAGITKGCNPPVNDRFCPDDSVTRGQMAAFLVRGLGYTDDGGGDLFTDDDLSVFETDIDRLGTAGVTKGCNPPVNDRFCPDDSVTRGQMAAFLVRALGYAGGGSDLFTDDDLSVFEDDIDRLGAAGVTKGCNPPVNDRFCPTEVVTRGQMAAFLTRALDLD